MGFGPFRWVKRHLILQSWAYSIDCVVFKWKKGAEDNHDEKSTTRRLRFDVMSIWLQLKMMQDGNIVEFTVLQLWSYLYHWVKLRENISIRRFIWACDS